MKSQQEINEQNQRRLKALAADVIAEKAEKESRKQVSPGRKAKPNARSK